MCFVHKRTNNFWSSKNEQGVFFAAQDNLIGDLVRESVDVSVNHRPHPQLMLKRSALPRNFLMSPTVSPKGTLNATDNFIVTVFATRRSRQVVRLVRVV